MLGYAKRISQILFEIEDSHKCFKTLLKLEPKECASKTLTNVNTWEAYDVQRGMYNFTERLDESKCDDAKVLLCLTTLKCESSNQEKELSMNNRTKTEKSFEIVLKYCTSGKSRKSTRKTSKKITIVKVQHLEEYENDQKNTDSDTQTTLEDFEDNLDNGFNSDGNLNPSNNVRRRC